MPTTTKETFYHLRVPTKDMSKADFKSAIDLCSLSSIVCRYDERNEHLIARYSERDVCEKAQATIWHVFHRLKMEISVDTKCLACWSQVNQDIVCNH